MKCRKSDQLLSKTSTSELLTRKQAYPQLRLPSPTYRSTNRSMWSNETFKYGVNPTPPVVTLRLYVRRATRPQTADVHAPHACSALFSVTAVEILGL